MENVGKGGNGFGIAGMVLGIVASSGSFLQGLWLMAPPMGETRYGIAALVLSAPVWVLGLVFGAVAVSNRQRFATTAIVTSGASVIWVLIAIALDVSVDIDIPI